jgi:hypothetical protein
MQGREEVVKKLQRSDRHLERKEMLKEEMLKIKHRDQVRDPRIACRQHEQR